MLRDYPAAQKLGLWAQYLFLGVFVFAELLECSMVCRIFFFKIGKNPTIKMENSIHISCLNYRESVLGPSEPVLISVLSEIHTLGPPCTARTSLLAKQLVGSIIARTS